MKKIYKTDIGTKTYYILFGLPTAAVTFYLLFISTNTNIFGKIVAGIFFFGLLWLFPAKFTFKITIDDDYISTEDITPFPGPMKFKWDEIEYLKAYGGFLFQEGGSIFIRSKFHKRKDMVIPIGWGVSYEVIKDILPHLPKDATVKIEPFLRKYIEGEPKVYTKRRLSIIAILLVLMVIGGFLLSWFLAFHNPWMK